MEKLRMESLDKVTENVRKIAALFPNCVTERRTFVRGGQYSEKSKTELVIDFDKLKQELSDYIVEGAEERYQFTWPDKKKAILTANSKINKTLRPCREESVNFDTTENLYIEGDNLEVLKLLQETYLGKVKMIYIDPPYNTGSDFVYRDNFTMDKDEYMENSGQSDEDGNRMVQNLESNGRYHTDWLNMMYPRLKLARDLLADDGVIFIHIDEHEDYTLHMMCNEIFGKNELGTIIWDKRNPKGESNGVAYQHESIKIFAKNKVYFTKFPFAKKKEHAALMINKVQILIKKNKNVVDDGVRKEYKLWIKSMENILTGGEKAYSEIDESGRIYQNVSMAAPDKPETRSHKPLIHPITKKPCPVPSKGWRFKDDTMRKLLDENRISYGTDENTQPRQKYFLDENLDEAVSSLLYYGGDAEKDLFDMKFDNPKPVDVVIRQIYSLCKEKNEVILDFFSGSATTAHAVMQLNAEDGGHRKFIMVQLPELTDEKSETYKAGYKNICEIGKERIRRAGAKIKSEHPEAKDLDIGFRVLKCDSSNMKDVYYTPAETVNMNMFDLVDNVKEDRTAEDLLFQCMLEFDAPLSSAIETMTIGDKTVYNVAGGHLMACFDTDVTEEVITEVAKLEPSYFVMRDSSLANDSVAANFEQIFKTYSPSTERRVL